MAEIPNRTQQRSMEMLELLSRKSEGLFLHELAKELALPRSTAHNLAQSLVQLGYVYQRPETGKYLLSLKMFEVGACAIHSMNAVEYIRSLMLALRDQVNETVHLSVRSGTDVLYVDKMDSLRSVRMSSYAGWRAPLHCTALGNALLSTMDDAQVRALYAGVEMIRATPRSIADIDALLDRLAEVRRQGYALEREEYNANVSCVAVPLRNGAGEAVYAMSVSAPMVRMDDSFIAKCVELLRETQAKIEVVLKNT